MVLKWKHDKLIASRDQTILNKWENGTITTEGCFKSIAKHNDWDLEKVTLQDFFDLICEYGWADIVAEHTIQKYLDK